VLSYNVRREGRHAASYGYGYGYRAARCRAARCHCGIPRADEPAATALDAPADDTGSHPDARADENARAYTRVEILLSVCAASVWR